MVRGMDSEHDSRYGKSADSTRGDVTFIRGAVPPPDPLPRGQHHLPREYVARHQRMRILDATTFVLAERGYGATTIGDIVARAHVSRRTFYAHFETKEHCVLATFGAAIECIADAVRAAYSGAGGVGRGHGRRPVPADERAGAVPADRTHLLPRDPLGRRRGGGADHGGTADVHRRAAAASWATGRARAPVEAMALEMGVGGLIAVIRARFAADTPEALQRELPEIAEALLEPLAGPEATRAVVARIEAEPQFRAVHAI